MAPMHVQNAREVPEYEINASELDFTNSVHITKVYISDDFLYSLYLFYSWVLQNLNSSPNLLLPILFSLHISYWFEILGNFPYCIMAWHSCRCQNTWGGSILG